MTTDRPSARHRLDAATLRRSWQSWVSSDLAPSGPAWLQWVWTGLFSAGLAVGFTFLGFLMNFREAHWTSPLAWAVWYRRNLVVCLVIGYLIHVMYLLLIPRLGGRERIRQWAPWQRTLLFSGVPIVGVAIGWGPGLWLAGLGNPLRWGTSWKPVIGASLAMSVVISLVLHYWFSAKSRQIEAERRATEAQLRLLQGQIEPHFLFNTLANVHSLIDYDAPKAKAMLGAFTSYLRASMGGLRSERATLADELDLARAYLTVLGIRMEERLRFDIEADEDARRVAMPPMLLQPLVENAVHHGLEPKIEGGRVTVRAALRDGRLWVEVRDDGVGPGASRRGGNGMALANLRERLATHYGDLASLTLEEASPGCRVTLWLPLRT